MYSLSTLASHRSFCRSTEQLRLAFVQPVPSNFNHVRFHFPLLTSTSPSCRKTVPPTCSSSTSFTQTFRPTLRRPRPLPSASRSFWANPLPISICPTCSHLNGTKQDAGIDAAGNKSENKLDSYGKRTSGLPFLSNVPVRSLAAVAAVGAIVYTIQSGNLSSISAVLDYVTSKARTLGPLRAAGLLCCVNFMTVLFCFPANMGLMVAAGAILPAPFAFAALFFSKLLAACAAFMLGRTFLRSRAENWLENHPRLQKVLARPEVTRWTFVSLLRLSPFPGFVLNYLLSLTSVPFGQYVLGTVVGIAPSIANLVLIGNAAKGVGQTVAAGATLSAWLAPALKLAMVSSMFLVTLHVTKLISAALDEQPETGSFEENGATHHKNGDSHTNGSGKASPIHVPTTVYKGEFNPNDSSACTDDSSAGITIEIDSQPVTRGRRLRDD